MADLSWIKEQRDIAEDAWSRIRIPNGHDAYAETERDQDPLKSEGMSERKDGKKGSRRIGSAADLRRKAFPALRYVVPKILAEGCTLLAGRPKLGKSWLMLDVGLAVAAGRICLGETRCEQGEVLYLALEDNERRLQRRIDKLLGTFGVEWPEAFQYATEWPRANDGGVEAIRDWIVSAKNPRLVVVDVLMMFRTTGNRDNQYEADYNAIKGLQALAGEFNVAIVIVHHTRKSGSDVDPFEKVSGTLGLSGAADAALILDRDGNGATLYGRGRDVEEIEVAVSFDKPTCRWTILGAAAEVRRTDERSEILSVLIEADEPMGPREIAVAADMPRNNVDQLLYKMGKAGEVLKAGRGRYVHPERSDLIEAPPRSRHKSDKKIRQGEDGPPATEIRCDCCGLPPSNQHPLIHPTGTDKSGHVHRYCLEAWQAGEECEGPDFEWERLCDEAEARARTKGEANG